MKSNAAGKSDMVKWDILEYPGCLQSCVWGWRELYAMAEKRNGKDRDGKALLIPAFSGDGLPRTDDAEILDRLREEHSRGTIIASACAGSAWIAAAALDRGRTLATHWSLCAALAARRPDVRVTASELVIDHGDIISAGGLMAWADLGLRLVERFWGKKAADDCSRSLVWDRDPGSRTPHFSAGMAWEPIKVDPALTPATAWISARWREYVRLDEWAAAAALGLRSFQRRWKESYGCSPRTWLQSVRVEEARRLLERSDETWEAVTHRCGYEDPSSFREIFQRSVGWNPSTYRRKFRS